MKAYSLLRSMILGMAILSLGLLAPSRVLALDPAPTELASARLCSSSRQIKGIVTKEKVISFTFDDGPWPTNTQAVMRSFEKYSWKATFFMVGNNAKRFPTIARDVVSRGFAVGNHSMTHSTYSQTGISREIGPAQTAIRSVTGVTPKVFRAPGGNFGTLVNSTSYTKFGMCNIWTDSDLGDWRSPRASSATLCSRFKTAVRPGSIILLHDGGSHTQTVNAVPCMLAWAKSHGYNVLPLEELLRAGSVSGYR